VLPRVDKKADDLLKAVDDEIASTLVFLLSHLNELLW
jgi:hypothetical protein